MFLDDCFGLLCDPAFFVGYYKAFLYPFPFHMKLNTDEACVREFFFAAIICTILSCKILE